MSQEELPNTNDAAQCQSPPKMENVSNAETADSNHSQRRINGRSREDQENRENVIKFKGKCHNCGKKGHKFTSCTKPYNRDQARRRCYKCGKPGHIARNCRQKKSGPGMNAVLTNCTNCTFTLTTGNLPKEK